MTRLSILVLAAALTTNACGTSASDATDTALTADGGAAPADTAAAQAAAANGQSPSPRRPLVRSIAT
jgi:hypothetical protein